MILKLRKNDGTGCGHCLGFFSTAMLPKAIWTLQQCCLSESEMDN